MSKCWYCNEELTTGNNPEHLGICDNCYNNMFKAGNDLIGKMTTKIADLEAKLAERDKTIDEINEEFLSAIKDWKQLVEIEKAEKAHIKQQLADTEFRYENLHNLYYKDTEELKQQLAKRDKEITKLKSDKHALMSDNAYQEADIFEFNSRIEQLQQQLAEKEKEIETLTKLKAKEMGKSLYGIVGSLEKITNESVNMAKSHQAIKGNVQ